jgi:acetyl-CoA synthetase (ADP-forming)
MEEALLRKYKIAPVKSGIAKTEAEALRIAAKLKYPVALKIISPDILHKSDRGCVQTSIAGKAELKKAYSEIMANAKGSRVDGMLVQKMGRHGVELIVGGKRDPQFGQLILFGMGGIFVEVFKDVSMRICPIAPEDAAEMIREIKAYPILAGARGTKPVDEEALIELLVKTSRLLVKENPKELDFNPVIADSEGYDIVDVRIIR